MFDSAETPKETALTIVLIFPFFPTERSELEMIVHSGANSWTQSSRSDVVRTAPWRDQSHVGTKLGRNTLHRAVVDCVGWIGFISPLEQP